MNRPVVAVTGANGYVGSLIARALAAQAEVVGMVRKPRGPEDIAWSFDADPESLESALRQRGVTHLIHAAWDMKANSLSAMERGCVGGSSRLFAAATAAGVERTTFISSISAFAGARSAYGRSKLMVEEMIHSRQGVVLRLGLVYGEGDGGVYGNLKRIVAKAHIIPMIGDGGAPQYLLHERTLAEVVQRAVRGDFEGSLRPLTVAQPEGIAFRALLGAIAAAQKKQITCVPVPWRLLYLGLKTAETAGLKLNFRSDSVISFIFQNPAPDFEALARYGVDPIRLEISETERPTRDARAGQSGDRRL
jgi:nucleoside-diphosphate-sugar epimerase